MDGEKLFEGDRRRKVEWAVDWPERGQEPVDRQRMKRGGSAERAHAFGLQKVCSEAS